MGALSKQTGSFLSRFFLFLQLKVIAIMDGVIQNKRMKFFYEVKGLNKYLVIDFETTGNKPKDGDRIIQVGAVLVDNGTIVDRYATLVNPGVTISPFIENLTGITNSMVSTAPSIDEILPDLLRLTDDVVLVGHNIYFDLSFLQSAFVEGGYLPFSGFLLDTVEMARLLLPSQDGYRLTDLSSELDIPLDRPHRADEDAEATAMIFLQLLQKMKGLPLITIQKLMGLTRSYQSDIYELLKFLEKEKMLHSPEEKGVDVYRQLCLSSEKKEGQQTGDDTLIPDDFSVFMEQLLAKDGLLERNLAGFEWRPSQLTMMNQVYESFKDGKHLVVEAGTGTGKSLAYLIPAAYWAKQEGEKVVISTHTIQLQEQLYNRDLPLLKTIFQNGIKDPVLLKGRNHYLCLRKYEHSLQEDHENYDFQLSKGQILVWLTETETGDIEEINLPSGGQYYWKQVQSDAASCLNRHCPWFSRCFYHNARRKAQQAELIITNHSLLFTDIQAEHRILPAYRYAIIDEAHHFDDVASRHLGHILSSFQVDNTFQFLLSERGGGLLEDLETALRKEKEIKPSTVELLGTLPMDIRQCRDSWREMFQIMHRWTLEKGKEGDEIGHTLFRYKKRDLQTTVGKGLLAAVQNALEWTGPLGKKLEQLLKQIQDQMETMSLTLRGLVSDLNGTIQDLLTNMELLHSMLLSVDEENVYWVELDRRGFRKGLYINQAPLDVSSLIRNLFFDQKDSVVLTSATMSVNDSFHYALERLGINDLYRENLVETSLLPSPFNFPEQALLCVPSEIPSIKDATEKEFILSLTQSLEEVARITGGKMLVLFTSHSMLKNAYTILKENLSGSGFVVLGHGIDSHSRSKLTRRFRTTKNSILLGTSSFWEGVDIPGDDLSCLAIVRLPFVPPNHPLLEARTLKMKEERRNPFIQLSVPQAVIRFKQGFGRLVRTMTDRGVVLVYDRRIVNTTYGKIFMNSLPKTPVLIKPTKEMLTEISNWIETN